MQHKKGKLSIIGIGPGYQEHMSGAALQALGEAEIVVGYKGYLQYISHIINEKERFATGMRGEKERAGEAVHLAAAGKSVAIVSGGDAGVYGMAGLVLEMIQEDHIDDIDVNVVPGISAANAAAALLGAPLMHDFVVLSLSDLLTDRELIEKRLCLAAEGDFITVLYNPKSKNRTYLIKRALEIFLQHRKPETPAAIVTNAYREGQSVELSTLAALDPEADSLGMSSVVVIGNTSSYQKGNWFITPRGYNI